MKWFTTSTEEISSDVSPWGCRFLLESAYEKQTLAKSLKTCQPSAKITGSRWMRDRGVKEMEKRRSRYLGLCCPDCRNSRPRGENLLVAEKIFD